MTRINVSSHMPLSRRAILSGMPVLAAGHLIRTQGPKDRPADPPLDLFDDVLNTTEWLPWDDFDGLLGNLMRLPQWPSDRDFQPDEWQQYCATAVSWQRSRPSCIETLVILAMLIGTAYRASPSNVDHWSTKYRHDNVPDAHLADWLGVRIMLLLRIMFNIPASTMAYRLPKSEYLIAGCSYYPAKPIGTFGENDILRIAAPIDWRDRNPRLMALSKVHEPGGIWTDYQPHIEYRYFRVNFPLRENLQDLVTDKKLIPPPLK